MKKIIITAALAAGVFTFNSVTAQETNDSEMSQVKEVSEEMHVYGNCGMCKKTIEKAALSVEGVTGVDWNKETKVITIKYDPEVFGKKGYSLDNVSMSIAESGYDTEYNKASDEAYSSLPGCCQYERE